MQYTSAVPQGPHTFVIGIPPEHNDQLGKAEPAISTPQRVHGGEHALPIYLPNAIGV